MRTWITSLWLSTAFLCLPFTTAPAHATDARDTPLVRAVRRAQTSVANIHSERTIHGERTARDRDSAFEGPGKKVNGMGTGIVIDERGYIVTNQHVIAEVDALRVTLHDGSTYTAQVISYDKKRDLAVIKIEPSRSLPVIPLGTSSDLKLGETVVAVGNAFGYEHTVTAGIISSLSRDVEVNENQSYKNLLQTDASINPGNSGGPLLNLDGEVVGINVAIRAGAQRIGFAIPIDDARVCIARLLNTGRLNGTYHGLVAHDVKTPEQRKLVVDAAESNSPAAAAGFLPGDVVTHVGKVPVLDGVDLERAILDRHLAGSSVDVLVDRKGETVKLTMQITKLDESRVASFTKPAISPIVRAKTPAAEEPIQSRSWKILGFKIEKASATQLERIPKRYNGGMRVADVRPDSPAYKHGIRKGDILVGLHIWETTKLDDINYVLNQAKLLSGPEPLRFIIVRGQEVLAGGLRFGAVQK